MTAKSLNSIFAIMIIVSLNIAFATKPTEDRIKNLSKEVVDSALYREIGLISDQLPYSVKYDYNRTIDDVSRSLKRLLEKTASIVFRTSLDKVIADEIEKRLQYYYLTKNDIHPSISYEFQQKLAAIRQRLDNKMHSYYKADYVTLKDIEDAVKWEIGYSFSRRIKNAQSDGKPSWGETLGKFGVDLAIGISKALYNQNTEKTTSEDKKEDINTIVEDKEEPTPSKLEKIYYSENCVICQFDFESGERVGVLNCGHTFHPDCIKQWLNQSKTCPLCRENNVFLAKIYDTKEDIPGYKPKVSTTQKSTQNIKPELPECSICLDEITDADCKILKCGHKYHEECINDWLTRDKTCPYCRSEDI